MARSVIVGDAAAFYAPYIPNGVGTKMRYEWRNYRPEGWTDDLGIISDQNRWLREELAGWYVFVPHQLAVEVHEWCKGNLRDDWNYGAGIPERILRISSDRDFTWFTMRWL